MTIEELAEIMHIKLCHLDHTEYCGWYYRDKDVDKWEQPYSAHKKYLDQAKKVAFGSGLPLEDIERVIRAL